MTRPSHSETRFVRPIPEEQILRIMSERGFPHPDDGKHGLPLALGIVIVGFSILAAVMFSALALAIVS